MTFEICQGISLEGGESLRSSFRQEGDSFSGLVSAQLIRGLAEGFIELIPEPVFFFLELAEEGEEYRTYYLDNCTKPVAMAIMDRYGELLINDGASRFGFGSHKSDEELYLMDFQEFSIYSPNTKGIRKLLTGLGITELEEPDSMYSLMSDDRPGSLTAVELEGETVFDIPEALKSAGMYAAE